MSNDIRLVDFETYCEICRHKDRKEAKDPCNECLDICAREGSSKPERWEGKGVGRIYGWNTVT